MRPAHDATTFVQGVHVPVEIPKYQEANRFAAFIAARIPFAARIFFTLAFCRGLSPRM